MAVIRRTDHTDEIGPISGVDPDFITTNYGDVIYALGGADDICAQGGNDKVFGGDDLDVIDGGDGDDVIYGDNGTREGDLDGDNSILGGNGNDTVYATVLVAAKVHSYWPRPIFARAARRRRSAASLPANRIPPGLELSP